MVPQVIQPRIFLKIINNQFFILITPVTDPTLTVAEAEELAMPEVMAIYPPENKYNLN